MRTTGLALIIPFLGTTSINGVVHALDRQRYQGQPARPPQQAEGGHGHHLQEPEGDDG